MMLQRAGPKYRPQVAALPFRFVDGMAQVLLVTSRESRRWIIPKGWPMVGRKDHEAAAREAAEEAGVTGCIQKHPIGAYTYDKRHDHSVEPCRVMVYALEVEREMTSWRERDQRQRRWLSTTDAAKLVSEPRLALMIRSFGQPHVAATA